MSDEFVCISSLKKYIYFFNDSPYWADDQSLVRVGRRHGVHGSVSRKLTLNVGRSRAGVAIILTEVVPFIGGSRPFWFPNSSVALEVVGQIIVRIGLVVVVVLTGALLRLRHLDRDVAKPPVLQEKTESIFLVYYKNI